MATSLEVTEILRFCEKHARTRKKKLEQEEIDLFCASFAEVDAGVLKKAAILHLKHKAYFPFISEIAAQVAEIEKELAQALGSVRTKLPEIPDECLRPPDPESQERIRPVLEALYAKCRVPFPRQSRTAVYDNQ